MTLVVILPYTHTHTELNRVENMKQIYFAKNKNKQKKNAHFNYFHITCQRKVDLIVSMLMECTPPYVNLLFQVFPLPVPHSKYTCNLQPALQIFQLSKKHNAPCS